MMVLLIVVGALLIGAAVGVVWAAVGLASRISEQDPE